MCPFEVCTAFKTEPGMLASQEQIQKCLPQLWLEFCWVSITKEEGGKELKLWQGGDYNLALKNSTWKRRETKAGGREWAVNSDRFIGLEVE